MHHRKRAIIAYMNSKVPGENAVSPEPMSFAHVSDRTRRNYSKRTRHVALLRDRACALKDLMESSKSLFLMIRLISFCGEIRKSINTFWLKKLGSVVQSVVSLTSLLVVKTLTDLVSTISNSQVFLLKNVSSFCKCKSYSHFFSKNNSVYVYTYICRI